MTSPVTAKNPELNHMEENNEDITQSLVATFMIDERYYGISTSVVREVVRVGEITPVHHSPDFILGIMNLRGRIVTVIDLGRKLSLNSLEVSGQSRIFIAEWKQEHVGLLVDRVGEVVPFEEEDLRPSPENLPANQAGMLHGVFHAGSILVGLLNLDTILDDSDQQKERLLQNESHK